MAFVDTSGSQFFITDVGTTERNITSFCVEASGFPGSHELSEVTAIGDAGRRFLPVRINVETRISGIWDDTTTTGLDAIIGPLRTHTSETAFRYVITTEFGTTTYSGSVWLETFEITGRVGNAVLWTMTLRVDNVITRAFVPIAAQTAVIIVTIKGDTDDIKTFIPAIAISIKGNPDDENTETRAIAVSVKGEPDDEALFTATIGVSIVEA